MEEALPAVVVGAGPVEPHEARGLAQPVPGVYVVGMKSYGRAPTFLALTGAVAAVR
jgi:hypothetical protein